MGRREGRQCCVGGQYGKGGKVGFPLYLCHLIGGQSMGWVAWSRKLTRAFGARELFRNLVDSMLHKKSSGKIRECSPFAVVFQYLKLDLLFCGPSNVSP